MPLERKPAAPDGQPAYPDAEEYSADRRGFLAMIGVVAAGAAGYFAYKSYAQPQAVPMGEVCPVAPANAPTPTNVNAPATPAAAAQGNVLVVPSEPQAAVPGKMAVQPQITPPAQPESQAEGGIRLIQPPPPAEPQAQPLGDVKAPEIRPPADPKANIRGGSGMLKKRSGRRQA
ncbi:MAG: hypothetical protein KIS92_20180 [Planctomycetota bacterium]|nr:hypothetical protein [Planctomycetota bacterium]